ncbi:MAG TPA: hypothetical protein PKC18_12130 [Lacipirellulaceae bacterium]|nr:hypothetical protein [Lacipirellulaceae bacterium]
MPRFIGPEGPWDVDDAEFLGDDESLDALLPDDDYEPLPEPGDFWPHPDAA